MTMRILLASFASLVLVAAPHAFQATPSASPLKVGDPAPSFSLMGSDGNMHTLADYKGKYVVLAWFPKAMTGGCTAECHSITENGEALKAFDVVYFMASVDTPELNKQFADRDKPDFPLLS